MLSRLDCREGWERWKALDQQFRICDPLTNTCNHPTSPRSVKCLSVSDSARRQVFGLAGHLLAPASQFRLNQCFQWSFRSCLPLRGSSGFAPDSLFSLFARIRHREQFQYRPEAGFRNHPD